MLMRPRTLVRALIVWLLVIAAVGRVDARDGIPGLSHLREDPSGEVTIDAEHIEYDQRANVITARGAVKITRGDMLLTADTVRVHRETQVADAEGSVVVVDPQGTLAAHALTLNLVEETGAMDEGSVFLDANRYQLTGDRFEKGVGQTYSVTNGSFTTCLCR